MPFRLPTLSLGTPHDMLIAHPHAARRGTCARARHVRGARAAAALAALVAALACNGEGAGHPGGEGRSSAGGSARRSYAAADQAMAHAMADSAEWPSYGRDYTNQRYSPLAQITPANAAQLRLRWRFHTGVPHAFETSPIVAGGTMYVSTPLDHVIALDARLGTKKWEWAPRLGTTIHCCGPVNRGVAVYDGRVFVGTLDARLVALDSADGHVLWETRVEDNEKGYSITGAPLAVDGMVITGLSGGEYATRGRVTAYDAATGALRWRFWTVPSPEQGGWWGSWKTTDPFGTPLHRDIAQEKRDSARYADAWRIGGAAVWQTPAVDLQRGLLIFSTGNPAPSIDGSVRPGDNLYASSIVAVELATGKLKWYFQEVPHNSWDFDAISPVVLFDARDASGRTVPVASQAGKTGWVYIVDRRTGQAIRRSDEFVPHRNMFAPTTQRGDTMQAAAFGGSEWSPTAYSPRTGYLYVAGLNMPLIYRLRPEPPRKGAWYTGGSYFTTATKTGTLSAIDASTGKLVWQVQTKKPMIGGVTVTAGGVVLTGQVDSLVVAYDARTGRQVWSYKTDAGVNAPPVSYAMDGRQYVAVAAGGNWLVNSPRGDEVLTFALPARLDSTQTARAR